MNYRYFVSQNRKSPKTDSRVILSNVLGGVLIHHGNQNQLDHRKQWFSNGASNLTNHSKPKDLGPCNNYVGLCNNYMGLCNNYVGPNL